MATAKTSSAAPKAPWLGKKQGKVDLDKAIFAERFHGPLVHEAVRAELSARRRGTASTKTRGEIAMTTAKAWRQKGTGRARAGALSAGQRTGGGVIFGPKPRGYTVKVNRKARRRALRAALTVHAERDSLAVVDASAFDEPATKKAAELLGGFGDGGPAAVVLADGEENCVKSFRNIAGVSVLHVNDLGVADVVGAARLVVSEAALEQLTRRAA
ncbi:MAG TPA: 50S ribosomal protein L4 [Thermoleophilaceae bacterium]|nr:50S ribosomal protein L4 [Thermoleophilaceae bacterium]